MNIFGVGAFFCLSLRETILKINQISYPSETLYLRRNFSQNQDRLNLNLSSHLKSFSDKFSNATSVFVFLSYLALRVEKMGMLFMCPSQGRKNAKYLPNLLIFLLETQKTTFFFQFSVSDWVGPFDYYPIVY